MRTITIEVLNEKAVKLLQDLEALKLIRLQKSAQSEQKSESHNWAKYKGTMSKQPLNEIDQQLTELRNEWE